MSLLSRNNYIVLLFCNLMLLQSFNNIPAYACPEIPPALWFVGILELENTVLPEKIEIIPSYDTNFRRGENGVFFGFIIFNETKTPIYIFGLDNSDSLVEAQNNNSLPEQINQLLTAEMGFQVRPKQNRPVFRLNGPMLQSFDPEMVEYNQFDYSIPENLEIPLPQKSSFLIISDEEIYTVSYQLSYELNNNFYEDLNACDRAMMGTDSITSTPAAPPANNAFPPFTIPLGILLTVAISGIIVAFTLNRKSS